MFDFHIHTIYSDGTDDIDSLVEKVKGIEYFSITDHDTIKGVKALRDKGLDMPNFVNGIELSTSDLEDSVHILFYDYDINSQALKEVLDKIDEIRRDRLLERIKILKKDFKIKFKKEDIEALLKLDNPTNVTSKIYEVSKKLLDEAWHGEAIRLVGIRLDNLSLTSSYQHNLFEETNELVKESKIDDVCDTLKNKYGYNIINKASLLPKKDKLWYNWYKIGGLNEKKR